MPKPSFMLVVMILREHFAVTSVALKRWLLAQAYDALAIGILWLIGLLLFHVPFAPLWAILAALLQFIPYFGALLALPGPAIAGALSGGFERLVYVLLLYAVISVTDAFLLQPYFAKRTATVPFWVSVLTPIVLGTVLSFWGVLLSVPILTIIYTYRARYRRVD